MVAISVDAEALVPPAIKCEDPTVLRNFIRRGENRVMPGANGRRRVSLPLEQVDEPLTFKVTGLATPAGTPNADIITGLEENLEHYRTLFLPDIVHDIVLTYAGTTFTGEAQIPEYAQARTAPASAIVIARFVISAGQLVAP